MFPVPNIRRAEMNTLMLTIGVALFFGGFWCGAMLNKPPAMIEIRWKGRMEGREGPYVEHQDYLDALRSIGKGPKDG